MPASDEAVGSGDRASTGFGVPYFASLVARYRDSVNDDGSPADDPTVERIIKEAEGGLRWDHMFALELAMVRFYSSRELSQRLVRLRDDFKSMVCPARYTSYEAQLKPSNCTDENIKRRELQNDTRFLLSEIQRLRYGTSEFESIRSRVRTNYLCCMAAIVVLMAAYGFCACWKGGRELQWSELPFVVLSGALGAAFSMAIRIAAVDPNEDVESILNTIHSFRKRAPWAPVLSVIEGMVAAIVLHALFVSKLLQGQLFPVFGDGPDNLKVLTALSAPTIGHSADSVSGLSHAILNFVMVHPQSTAGFALLVFWSFVAGFAERLIPDVLNQFTEAASSASKRAAAAGDTQTQPASAVDLKKPDELGSNQTTSNGESIPALVADRLDPGNSPGAPVTPVNSAIAQPHS